MRNAAPASVETQTAKVREVPGHLRRKINDAYTALVEQRGGKKRRGQQVIIGAVANAAAQAKRPDEKTGVPDRLLAVQAPTGTGKSFGYALGAIPVAIAQGLKVVIATGTVALQEQLVNEDMPRLAQVLEGMEVVLVKGRGRYACVVRTAEEAAYGNEKAAWLLEALEDGEWNGDVDELADPPGAREWAALTNDRNGCSGKKCSRYDECPYYKVREAGKKANVLVTNHDLLLSDILGGNTVLPKPADTVYVVDEAHEFPEKALKLMGEQHALRECERWASESEQLIARIRRAPGGKPLDKLAVEVAHTLANVRGWAARARMSIESSGAVAIRDPKRPLRFAHGKLPEWLADVASGSEEAAKEAYEALERLREAMDSDEGDGMVDNVREGLLAEVGRAIHQIEMVGSVWRLMRADEIDSAPPAKWVQVAGSGEDKDILVCASPVGVGEQLHTMLWSKCAAAIHLSATIYTVGGFAPFLRECGLDREGAVRTVEVESPFNYSAQGKLIVPTGIRNPKDAEGHTEDLSKHLPEWLGTREGRGGEGALVLFASKSQMLRMAELMPDAVKKRLLVQGQRSKRDILAAHRQAIESGETSFIFGTASFEQGIDLPGKLLTLVVVAKLQFSVPSNPVEEARCEWLESIGRSYFDEVAVPKACKRLAQSCGRLLRTVDDSGEIIVADIRLTRTRYGRSMLDTLPDFSMGSRL